MAHRAGAVAAVQVLGLVVLDALVFGGAVQVLPAAGLLVAARPFGVAGVLGAVGAAVGAARRPGFVRARFGSVAAAVVGAFEGSGG